MFDTVDDYLVHCYCNSCYYYLGFGNYCTSCAEVAVVVVAVAVDNSVDKTDFVDNYIADNKVVAAVDVVVADAVVVVDIADVVADADGIDEVAAVEVVVAVVDNHNSLFVLTDSYHTDIDVVDVAVLGIVGNY